MKTMVLIFSVIFFGSASVKTGPLPTGRPEEKLRAVYVSQLGVREATNRNDGPQVGAYLRYVGLKTGNPWCAAFASWCLGQAGIANPRSGYCPDFFTPRRVIWVRKSLKLKADNFKLKGTDAQAVASIPSTGDVFGLYFPEKGRIAHVGFIDEWGDKYAVTVEGNTNEAGSREGDGVYRKRRLISSICKVSRFIPPG